MIEPLLPLALSIQATPGVYTLLLGSGVSRSANILTGWEVVLDLIRKVALAMKENCEPDPAEWYRHKIKGEPTYAKLLESLANTPAERQAILRSYFDPTEDERNDGIKQPTAAHHGIARLVVAGHCRIIMTTNFDRLIERAIDDAGGSVTVIATPEAAEGAMPLAHQKCCVIKLNGDYLDPRLKNTPEELAAYDPAMTKLLDQVLDEYGLVCCGWSGEWDAALRQAIERSSNHRFTFYWATRSDPTEHVQRLVTLRKGKTILIEDADSFFSTLADLVTSLSESERTHPQTVEALLALEKRYLSEPRYRIQLADLVHAETERAFLRLSQCNQQLLKDNASTLEETWDAQEQLIETVEALLAQGCALDPGENSDVWLQSVARFVTQFKGEHSSSVMSDWVGHYPAAVLLYAAGIAAVATHRDRTLCALLNASSSAIRIGEKPLAAAISWRDFSVALAQTKRYRFEDCPFSQRLFKHARDVVRRYTPADDYYAACFDRFEYLLALVCAHYWRKKDPGSAVRPLFLRCFSYSLGDSPRHAAVDQEIDEMGPQWPLAKLGLFSSHAELLETRNVVLDAVRKR